MMNSTHAILITLCLPLAALGALAAPQPARADDVTVAPAGTAVAPAPGSNAAARPEAQLQEVVVTATRREESLSKVGLTIQALGGAQLEEQHIVSLEDLATAVQFAASIHAQLPVAASALACFEEAEAAGLGEADATTVSVRWTQRPAAASKS